MGLRWKIRIITRLTPLTLGLATLWTVHASVARHVTTSSIHESLERSSAVFESMLSARSEALAVAARVIVQDPRFFSLLGLRDSQRDEHFQKTVKGMARDFQKITGTDVFEVVDRKGRMLASVGSSITIPAARATFVKQALGRYPVSGILVEGHMHFQVVVMPVIADRQVAGALILGGNIGEELAHELQQETHSEVTFVSNQVITGTTLATAGDRDALLRALDQMGAEAGGDFTRTGITEVKGPTRTYFTVVRPIPGTNQGPRQLYVMQRSTDPEISFMHSMQSHLIQLGLIALVAALVTGFILSQQIRKPLQQLVRGAQEMEQGNYEYPILIKSRDEIGYLSDRFQLMRQHERVYVNSLEEAARLKSKFISVASHELRTPISVIRGYHDLLVEGRLGPLVPPQQQALKGIADSLSHLLRVAEEATLMAQVRGDRLELNRTEAGISGMLDAAIGMAMAQASERKVRVARVGSAPAGTALVDADMFTQAVCNLVCNGIRFTPDGGRVDLETVVTHGELTVEVRDSGVGIPEEKLAHIFGKSFILSEVQSYHSSGNLKFGSTGLGLGLSIARGIVEAHGGTISVESRVGHGSSFVIRVPLDMDEKLKEVA
jgi:signal transduction histidine kinase